MIIGVPRERKTLEKRVALIPNHAKKLIENGHKVLIEKDAGIGSFFTNKEYLNAGCEIKDSLKDLWEGSELVIKVKEPHKDEYKYFREDLIIFDYLHLAGLPEVAKELIKAKVTSIGYELIQTKEGSLPLLEPMSEIAGKLSVINGANFLLTQNRGRGVLLNTPTGLPQANVTIIGAGIAGTAAIKTAYDLGANVNILDLTQVKLDRLKETYPNINTFISTPETISSLSKITDLMILAVLVPGTKAPRVLKKEQIKTMQPGSVIVDIAIDQGGAVEGIRSTSLKEPTYIEHDIIHYAVPNMPSQVARTATLALTKATFPYIQRLANLGFEKAIENSEFSNAVNTHRGEFFNKTVKEALD